jgi:hypothetical protein
MFVSLHSVQTVIGMHPDSYPVGTEEVDHSPAPITEVRYGGVMPPLSTFPPHSAELIKQGQLYLTLLVKFSVLCAHHLAF